MDYKILSVKVRIQVLAEMASTYNLPSFMETPLHDSNDVHVLTNYVMDRRTCNLWINKLRSVTTMSMVSQADRRNIENVFLVLHVLTHARDSTCSSTEEYDPFSDLEDNDIILSYTN